MVQRVDRDDLLAALEREIAAFRAVLDHADLRTPVPACPGWDLTTLAGHLARVHRWARNAVVEGEMREDGTPQLTDRAAVVGWYTESAQLVFDALAAATPGTPCPGFGPPPRTVDFWIRRQPHEVAVHRWDAETAAGGRPTLDPLLSADGVDEVVEVMLPRQLRLGRCGPLPAAVVLEQSDGQRRWKLGNGLPTASVRADAATLLLLLWHRVPAHDVPVDGDVRAARAVLTLPLTP